MYIKRWGIFDPDKVFRRLDVPSQVNGMPEQEKKMQCNDSLQIAVQFVL